MIQVSVERKDHGRDWRQVGQDSNLFWKAGRLPNVVDAVHGLCSGLLVHQERSKA